MKRHPLFIKYRREWLHQATGYSKGYLSRVATGDMRLSRLFIKRVCLRLNEPEAELFLPDGTQPAQGSRGCAASKIGQWVEEKCKRENLSLRQAAAKTGLSYGTIADIIKGSHPQPETIMKLARGFSGDGERGLALQDRLLDLAGYRTQRFEDDQVYLRILPLLSPECQHIIEALVRELAKIGGIEVPTSEKSKERATRKEQPKSGERANK